MKDKLFSAHHQGMAGVVAPLVTHYHPGLFRQQVDDLSLAFIPPLGAHHHDVRQTCPSFMKTLYIKSQGQVKAK